MATTTSTSSPSTSSTSSSSNCRIEEGELEQKLFNVYNEEVKMCDSNGQSTQHIGEILYIYIYMIQFRRWEWKNWETDVMVDLG